MSNIWFPLQRAIRTAVQVLVAGAAILATTVLVAPQILTAIQDVLPGPAVAWISGAIAALAAISAAISRVMAIPAVDEWLKKLGAGSAPAGATAYTLIDGTTTPMTRRQWRAFVNGGGNTTTVGEAPIVTAEAIPAGEDGSFTPDGRGGGHFRIPRGLPGMNGANQDRAASDYMNGSSDD
ncbi:hypothetical protein K8F61_05085 [Microbacterium resistens]|uniref:Phage holin family protein n=1 Tax=Microbacterium resistens TaxID=156977 RepID=A0ABY3RU43_9MICO|nr:hypothetical protein [Microbacterium resistens]UGS27564.1 hypothetical protein K8F61_05085 [Microbacterium resistens]